MNLFATLSPDGRPLYLANLPNKQGGPVHHEWVHDDAGLRRFIGSYDHPGRSLYFTVANLVNNAGRRAKETVESTNFYWAEIDYKDHPDLAPEEILRRVKAEPLPPTRIVLSGHGIHCYWQLKEAVDARPGPAQDELERALRLACQHVGGDPQAAEAARLLRLPTSHNSKNGDRIEVTIESSTGRAYEMPSDLIEFWSDAPSILPPRVVPQPSAGAQGNGHAFGGGHAADNEPSSGPVDVDAALAAMVPGHNVNKTHCRVIPKLLREGMHPDDVREQVVGPTMEVAERFGLTDPALGSKRWTREEEERRANTHIMNSYNNLFMKGYDPASGVIPDWLPIEFYEAWEAALKHGRRPYITRNRTNFFVREGAAFEAVNEAPDNADIPPDSAADATADGTSADGTGEGAANETPAPGTGRRRRVVLSPYVPRDPYTFPTREYLYGKHYQRKVVSATIAPGGTGKTSQEQVEAVAMATCRNLLGEQPSVQCRVWLHNGEDSREELDRRTLAICQYYSIPQEELVGWLFQTSGAEMPLKVANGYHDLRLDRPLIQEITDTILEHQIDVVIFDPLVTLHGTAESDNAKMDTVMRVFTQIAVACDCAIEIAHHTRKLPAGGGHEHTGDDSRGASAVRDAVRAMRVLNHMGLGEAQRLGLTDLQRLSYVRVDRGKANTLPPAQHATWRKFENVELPNGDQVGVITPWTPPSADNPSEEQLAAEAAAEAVFLLLLDRYTADGRYVTDKVTSTTRYAPKLFAVEKEAREALEPKTARVALARAMARLMENGCIRVESYKVRSYESDRIVRVLKAQPDGD
jgi:RecA-family ATPase